MKGGGGGVYGRPLPTPLSIFGKASVAQWVRADLGTAFATGVSAWMNLANGANNYAEPTAGLQPAFTAHDATLSGLPTILFDGVTTRLVSAGFNLPTPSVTPTVILAVAKALSFPAFGCLVGDAGGLAQAAILNISANVISDQAGSAGPHVACPTNAWQRIRAELTHSAGDVFQVGAAQGTGDVGNAVSGGRAVGSASTAFFGNYAVWELVYLNRVPTAAEYSRYDKYVTATTSGKVAV